MSFIFIGNKNEILLLKSVQLTFQCFTCSIPFSNICLTSVTIPCGVFLVSVIILSMRSSQLSSNRHFIIEMSYVHMFSYKVSDFHDQFIPHFILKYIIINVV